MMPVVLAALSEGFAIRLVACCIEEFARRSIAGHPVALEITNVSTQRAWPAHLAYDPRLDDGPAGAIIQEARRSETCGAATPKRAAAPPASPRQTAGLLRGLQRLRQERLCTSRPRRADAAW